MGTINRNKIIINKTQLSKTTNLFMESANKDLCKLHFVHYSNGQNNICNCGKVYTRKSGLFFHIKSATGNQTWFNCSFCEKQFKEKGNMKVHQRIH